MNNFAFNSISQIQIDLPVFSERGSKKWISYGEDNLYPQFIASLFLRSAINRTAIQSKIDATIGNGLKTTDEDLNYVLVRANPIDSWNDVFEKCAQDYIMFGGWSINVIWSNDGESIAEFYHVDFSRVRSGIYNPECDRVDRYYYAVDWTQWRKFKPLEYAAYDPSKSLEEPSQLIYGFDYEPNTIFYPLPSYSGGINDIQTDIEVSLFHINNLQNGLTPSLFIGLNNGVPDDLARQEIYDEITMAFKGAENAGKAFVAFSDTATVFGSITRSVSAVLYNTTSDQRLKENIVDAPEFGSVIDSIKVRSYDWKSDGSHQRAGFVAQELVTVAPEAVHQPEDTEEMMAVDYSKLVPMLVKEIQSLRKRLADAVF